MKNIFQKLLVLGFVFAFGVVIVPRVAFALNVGDACSGSCDVSGGTCTTGVGCYCSASFDGLCVPRGSVGVACTATDQCQSGFYCPDTGSRVCTARLRSEDEPTRAYCWCKKEDGTCQNHVKNDAPAGTRGALTCDHAGTALDGSSVQDTLVCEAYCHYRGWQAVHCEPVGTWHDYATVSDGLPDTSPNHCKVTTDAPTETPTTPAGLGDGGENRFTPTDFHLQNPLGTTDFKDIVSKIIRAVLGVVGALFLVMFIYGGVMWMTAGDSKRVDTAKKTFVNAVIGMVIIAFSYSMVTLVFNIAGQVAGG